MSSGNVVVCVLGMLLFVYWEICCYLGIRIVAVVACIGNAVFFLYIGNAVIIWVVGSCYYLGIGNDVAIYILGMLLLFG